MDEQTDENTVNKVIKKGEELIKQGNTEFLNAKIKWKRFSSINIYFWNNFCIKSSNAFTI